MKNKSKEKKLHIKTSFTAGKITNYSGALPAYKFMKKLGLVELLGNLSLSLGQNAKYSTGKLLSLVILGIVSGLNRIAKIESFSRDPLIQEMLSIRDKIDEDTIANRFKKFGMKQTNELMEMTGKMSLKVRKKLGEQGGDILDLDSTVRTVYGNQEGTGKGYNPHKKGARSYHPLMGFLNSTRECLLSWLRPGDAYTSNNAPEFMKQIFSMLGTSISLLVRGDSGFFDNQLIKVIEARRHTAYIIKVKMKNLTKLLSGKDWEKIPFMAGWEMTEFYHKSPGWQKSRKFVALRRKTKETKEGRLFTHIEYDYFCYVTNINDSPLLIHKMYGDRGTCENWIEAVKNQMFAGSILTDNFWANEAFWMMSVIAYNVSLWMRVLTDEKSWQEEPNTFRSWFTQLAGKMVHSGRQVYLKMYEAYHYKERWRKIEDRVDNLQFA